MCANRKRQVFHFETLPALLMENQLRSKRLCFLLIIFCFALIPNSAWTQERSTANKSRVQRSNQYLTETNKQLELQKKRAELEALKATTQNPVGNRNSTLNRLTPSTTGILERPEATGLPTQEVFNERSPAPAEPNPLEIVEKTVSERQLATAREEAQKLELKRRIERNLLKDGLKPRYHPKDKMLIIGVEGVLSP